MIRPWHSLYPQGVSPKVAIPNQTIYELLEGSVLDAPTHKAVIYEGKELTYSELKTACDRLAAALYNRGIRKGERIAVMLPNSVE
ncbi:AMP-binding protein [Sporosarcina soli]|uniref:AMP-binding protein n=1 Tax=Sporosarcina soli TaxID=334736 RepID=A0ABW0TDM2_9BACL